jgi:hypothetical protein
MAKRSILTAARLREVLHYNPETGEFRWISHYWQRWRSKVGCVQTLSTGYKRLVIWVANRHHRASRLAWLYMTGEWPVGVIDHINGNSLDNRWLNLRDVSKGENQRNRHRLQRNNTSGYAGVTFVRLLKPWAANYGGKRLGYFKTKEEAHAAVLQAKQSERRPHTQSGSSAGKPQTQRTAFRR